MNSNGTRRSEMSRRLATIFPEHHVLFRPQLRMTPTGLCMLGLLPRLYGSVCRRSSGVILM